MSSLLTDEEIRSLALTLVRLSGRNPEYVDTVDVVSTYLEDNGHDLTVISDDVLDGIYEKVSLLCLKAEISIP